MKQHAAEQPMGQTSKQKRNKYFNINKKWKYNMPDLWDIAKEVLTKKDLKKNTNLSLYLKKLVKEQRSSNLMEGRR